MAGTRVAPNLAEAAAQEGLVGAMRPTDVRAGHRIATGLRLDLATGGIAVRVQGEGERLPVAALRVGGWGESPAKQRARGRTVEDAGRLRVHHLRIAHAA